MTSTSFFEFIQPHFVAISQFTGPPFKGNEIYETMQSIYFIFLFLEIKSNFGAFLLVVFFISPFKGKSVYVGGGG